MTCTRCPTLAGPPQRQSTGALRPRGRTTFVVDTATRFPHLSCRARRCTSIDAVAVRNDSAARSIRFWPLGNEKSGRRLAVKQPEAKSRPFSLPISCRYKTPSTGLLTANCKRPCPAIRSVAGPTGAQRVAYPLSGSIGIECVKSTWPIAPPLRLVPCVVLRLAYDPHPIPGGLLPRRHLRRLSGVFPHVADREPLGVDLLLHFLLSHLEYIRFRPTRQFSHGELQPEVFDTTSVASTCAFGCTFRTSSEVALPANQACQQCGGLPRLGRRRIRHQRSNLTCAQGASRSVDRHRSGSQPATRE